MDEFKGIMVAVMLGLLGGAAREVQKLEKDKFDLRKFLIGLFISAVAGLVIGFFAMAAEINNFMIHGLTCVAGFMGYPLLTSLGDKLIKKVKDDDSNKKKGE